MLHHTRTLNGKSSMLLCERNPSSSPAQRAASCDCLASYYMLGIAQISIDNLLGNGITLEQTVDETLL